MPHRVTSSVRTDRKFSEIYFRNSFELSKKSLVTRHWRKWLSIISDGKYVSSFTEYENIFEARRDRPNPEHCGEEKRYLKRLAPPGAHKASRYHKRNSTNWSFNVRPYPGYRYAVVKAVKAWKSTHSPGTNERRSVSTQFVMESSWSISHRACRRVRESLQSRCILDLCRRTTISCCHKSGSWILLKLHLCSLDELVTNFCFYNWSKLETTDVTY